MESLNTSGMLKNRHLSKSIQEQLFHEFKGMEHKSFITFYKFLYVRRRNNKPKFESACNK